MIKALALLATAAAAGFAVRRMSQKRKAQAARVKPNSHADGQVRQLRQDPKTGEYYAED